MKNIFNQKRDLKLIDCEKKIEEFDNKKPEFIFIIANHDLDSTILNRELKDLTHITFDLKFSVSNFMGYGLFMGNIYTYEDFMKKFEDKI